MRRVSSRQRLSSWDAFDATTIEQEEEEEEQEELKRKQRCSPATLVPAFASELETTTTTTTTRPDTDDSSFRVLSCDELGAVCAFLDVPALRALGQTSRTLRTAVHSSPPMWQTQVERQWPWLKAADGVDELQLSVPVVPCNSQPSLHYSLLLSLGTQAPTHFDTNVWKEHERTMSQVSVTDDHKFQFTGRVGVGNRCLRANVPFGATQQTPARHKQQQQQVLLPGGRGGFLDKLQAFHCHRRRRRQQISETELPRPFCIPYWTADGDYNWTPRWVSYFEVDIDQQTTTTSLSTSATSPNSSSKNGSCIAIGLATSHFLWHFRMPGWDLHSYGYHGDDGGIFHQAGHMINSYGPKFGPGDTVGCGLDVLRRTIFFTVNGNYLGDAFSHVNVAMEYYPVLGLDSNCPVQPNFGADRPFRFDLCAYRRGQDAAVRHVIVDDVFC